jgi:GTPase
MQDQINLTTLDKAYLVGVYFEKQESDSAHEHIEELESLAYTYGFRFFERNCIRLRKYDAATYITKGKVEEIQELLKEKKFDVVIFDDEISPNQQRNLEKTFGVPVLDRTGLILEVFTKHAKTKEARLQIELAKVRYQMPRLKRLWTHLSRQRSGGGGAGAMGGEGEKQIEIDKRIMGQRVASLTKQIKAIREQRDLKRASRMKSAIPSIGIIGYTNVGKSTLLKALTDADVLIEDKLFATLDTTARQFTLPNHQKIILIDTVGFIRKLPHNLISAFRSTLEEACFTDILLHIIDVSNPSAFEHAKTSMQVLKELKAEDKPMIHVLNKIDVCEDKAILQKFRVSFTNAVRISAKSRLGFDELFTRLEKELSVLRKTLELKIPHSEQKLIAEIKSSGHIISTEYTDNFVEMSAQVPNVLLHKVEPYLSESQ